MSDYPDGRPYYWKSIYPQSLAHGRLQEIKAKYDADNMFSQQLQYCAGESVNGSETEGCLCIDSASGCVKRQFDFDFDFDFKKGLAWAGWWFAHR